MIDGWCWLGRSRAQNVSQTRGALSSRDDGRERRTHFVGIKPSDDDSFVSLLPSLYSSGSGFYENRISSQPMLPVRPEKYGNERLFIMLKGRVTGRPMRAIGDKKSAIRPIFAPHGAIREMSEKHYCRFGRSADLLISSWKNEWTIGTTPPLSTFFHSNSVHLGSHNCIRRCSTDDASNDDRYYTE